MQIGDAFSGGAKNDGALVGVVAKHIDYRLAPVTHGGQVGHVANILVSWRLAQAARIDAGRVLLIAGRQRKNRLGQSG